MYSFLQQTQDGKLLRNIDTLTKYCRHIKQINAQLTKDLETRTQQSVFFFFILILFVNILIFVYLYSASEMSKKYIIKCNELKHEEALRKKLENELNSNKKETVTDGEDTSDEEDQLSSNPEQQKNNSRGRSKFL